MMLNPLPIPTRVYHGESVLSYALRLAQRNHSDVTGIELALRNSGMALPHHRRLSPERIALWRELGGLNSRVFTTPTVIHGEPVTERSLCLHCAQGHAAVGRLPHVGLVCLRHKRWLELPQRDLHTYRPAVIAEQHYRTQLVPRGICFDSFPMELGLLCASPAFLGAAEIQRRSETSGISNTRILIYPEQIKFVRLITQRAFLQHVTDPQQPGRQRRDRVAQEVLKIVPPRDDSENWRATDRLWEVVTRLTRFRRENALWGAPVRDTYCQLLRFLDLYDLATDQDWGLRAESIRTETANADAQPSGGIDDIHDAQARTDLNG